MTPTVRLPENIQAGDQIAVYFNGILCGVRTVAVVSHLAAVLEDDQGERWNVKSGTLHGTAGDQKHDLDWCRPATDEDRAVSVGRPDQKRAWAAAQLRCRVDWSRVEHADAILELARALSL